MKPGAVVLGVPLDDVTLGEAVDRCSELVEVGRRTGRTHQVTTVNVDFIVNALDDARLRRVLQESDLAVPDGMPVVWGSRLLGAPLRERVAGADLVPALAERAAREGYRMYLFGSADGVAERAAALLEERYPGAVVTGTGGPQFRRVDDMDPGVLEEIRDARPDILCVALGHPKQERWIARHRAALGVPVLIGVGGTLDFLVGAKRRAPQWMRRAGLEWAHRVATEPRRLAGRYARDLTHYFPLVLQQAWLTRGEAPPWTDTDDDADGMRIVDLSGIDRLDGGSIAALVALARRIRAAGGDITLASVSAPAARSLAALRLDQFLLAAPHQREVPAAAAERRVLAEVDAGEAA